MKKIYLLLTVLATIGMTAVAQTPWLHTEGNKIKDPEGNTVILRGVDTQDIKGLYEQGNLFKVADLITNKNDTSSKSPGWYPDIIRLAIDPISGDFQSYYEKILKPVVDTLTKRGIYVILDNHFIEDVEGNVEYTNNFWKFFAPRFKNYPNVLFEVYNEPINSNLNWEQFRDQYMQPWVNLIREYAPHNLIVVGSPNYSRTIGDSDKFPLSGGNIIYVAHIYPQHFRNPSGGDKSQVQRAAKVNPVILTEWGFSETVPIDPALLKGTVADYGQPIMDWMEGMGVSWTAWCADDDWAPAMFNSDWSLKTGPGEMGGFVKDILYAKKDSNKPEYIECKLPDLGSDISICGKTSIDLNSGIAKTGVAFAWYKNDTLLPLETDSVLKNITSPGKYKVETTFGSCKIFDDIKILKLLEPIDLGPDTYLTDSITLAAGNFDPKLTYKWYKNDNQLIANATGNKLIVFEQCHNKFYVTVSSSDCPAISDTFKVVCERDLFLGKPLQIPGIVEAEYYDVQNGTEDIAYHDKEKANKGGKLRGGGVDVEATKDVNGGYNVGWIDEGEWLEYSVKVAETGTYMLKFRIASQQNNGGGPGNVDVFINNRSIVSGLEIPYTGAWQTWDDISAGKVKLNTTDTVLKLYFNSGGFNLNYLEFVNVTGVEEKLSERGFSLYPNPSESVLNISSVTENPSWSVVSLAGRVLSTGIGNVVDINNLEKGFYLLKIDGITRSFVKK